MEEKILTTTQLWQNYDPYLEPLRPSYLVFEEQENSHYYLEAYINGDSYENKPVRIFVRGYIPKHKSFNSSIIFIGDYSHDVSLKKFETELINKGYGIFSFDYVGYSKTSSKYTRYPSSINYANLVFSQDHLDKAIPSSKDTCVFIWSKVLRKVISLVKQLRGDDTQILLTGYRHGADLAWQVAAVDDRVDALTCILNAGWKEFANIPKWTDVQDLEFNDERKRWLTASATQSYIKFVKCPCLILAATNCYTTSVDRISDTVRLLSDNQSEITLNISVGQNTSVSKESQLLYLDWIEHISKKKHMPLMPVAKLSDINGQVIAHVAIDKSEDINKITLHYSYDDLDSRLRSWSSQIISIQGLKTDIPIFEATKRIFAYVSVKYKNGYELSSVPVFHPLNPKIEYKRKPVKKSRIIYQTSFGTSPWFIEQASSYMGMLEPRIDIGPLGIPGITSDTGSLATYTIGEYKYKSENQNLLQFDASSEEDCTLTICIIAGTITKFHRYYAKVNIRANSWTKCSLKLSDFKTSNLVPLKEWGNVKKLTIIDINKTLINNVIWV